jgi:hypothetical protein
LQNTPLHPIADWGRQRFGGADGPAEKRLADLENLLDLVKLDPAENAALLAPLLDIPLPPERAMALAPEELRRRQLAALTSLVMASARGQPVVIAVKTCSGPIRPRLNCCVALPNAGRWRHCSFSSPPGRSFGRRGVSARITARSRSRHSTAIRCGKWLASWPPRAAEGSDRWRD